MKKCFILAFFANFLFSYSHAQNTFPTTGKVGIGTTSPGLKLSVEDNGVLDAGNAYYIAQFYRPQAQQYGVSVGYDTGGYGLLQSNGANSGLQLKYNNTGIDLVGMTLSNNGSIGIGTTSPDSKLNVVDNLPGTEMTGLSLSNLYDGPGTAVGINFQPHSLQVTMAKIVAYREANAYGPTDMIFYTYNDAISPKGLNERMRINPTGNVLIGKSSQVNTSYKLDVDGVARANQIIVNTTGADFVFNKDYRLISLNAVEKYINSNHHLPAIASADQMVKDGLDVGEMNKKLLQKVEELTLYLIDKDKEIKQLNKRVAKLEKNPRKENTFFSH